MELARYAQRLLFEPSLQAKLAPEAEFSDLQPGGPLRIVIEYSELVGNGRWLLVRTEIDPYSPSSSNGLLVIDTTSGDLVQEFACRLETMPIYDDGDRLIAVTWPRASATSASTAGPRPHVGISISTAWGANPMILEIHSGKQLVVGGTLGADEWFRPSPGTPYLIQFGDSFFEIRPRGKYAKIDLAIHGCDHVEAPPAFSPSSDRFAIAGANRVEVWHQRRPMSEWGVLSAWQFWLVLAGDLRVAWIYAGKNSTHLRQSGLPQS